MRGCSTKGDLSVPSHLVPAPDGLGSPERLARADLPGDVDAGDGPRPGLGGEHPVRLLRVGRPHSIHTLQGEIV